MNICLFSKDEIEKPLDKKDERAQHILKILHKKEGDFFYAGIIDGKAGNAQITEITDSFIKYTFIPQSDGKPLFPLIMIIGFPRPIQLKRLLRDIAALGVKEVHLTATELGEKSYMQSNLVEHGSAYKMLLDGTVQAASTQVPKLFLHRNFEECIKTVKKSIPENSIKLCLDNVFPQGSLSQILKKTELGQENEPLKRTYVAAIGSERGWTDKERTYLKENGFILCGRGSRIMRTETAATVSASIISANAGWMD